MGILNYTTQIDSEKSIGEITKRLVKHGATKIVTDYTDKVPTSVSFWLPMNGTFVAFSLPANYEGVLNSMKKDRKVPSRLQTKEQALRVSWRIVKDWTLAQCAIVEAQLAEVSEVFLPYAVTKTVGTLFQDMKSGGMKMLQLGE